MIMHPRTPLSIPPSDTPQPSVITSKHAAPAAQTSLMMASLKQALMTLRCFRCMSPLKAVAIFCPKWVRTRHRKPLPRSYEMVSPQTAAATEPDPMM